jgi:uncharacterized protein (TIGR02145 family)
MGWPKNISSITPARYQFKLVTETQSVICDPEPIEWASGSLEMKRDLTAGGVFVSFACDSLTFVGTGAKLLKDLFEADELNAKCTLVISWWKGATRSYIEFPNRFSIDFNFYETVKVGSFTFGVRVKAVNSSMQTKLDSRQDIDVDITKLVSIGGFNIVEFPFTLKKKLRYSATDMYYNAKMSKDPDNSQFQHTADLVTYSSIPINKISSQFAEIQSAGYTTNQSLGNIPSFFVNALFDYVFDIKYTIVVVVDDRWAGSDPFTLQILETSGVGIATAIINAYELGTFGNEENAFSFDDTVAISVSAGNSLKLVVMNAGIDAQYHAHSVEQYLTITQKIASAPITITEGFPVYDAMERVLQHILDVQYPFYSEFFGRTEKFYNSLTAFYATENQLRFAHIQSGLNQRGLPLNSSSLPSAEGTPLLLNFKNLFKCMQAIWNVGYSFEILTGETTPRIRIEEYSHFFQNVEVLDLSSRINKYDIQSVVMPELVPNDLKSGFDNFEYLSANGRAEPNTTSERTSVINTATKFENISPLRGDTKGILDNLSSPISVDESKDTKGDSDVFIVKSQKSATYEWIPETGENITVDNGTSLFGESLLNRYFTPSRMLIRQGNRIKTGMTKLDSLSVLRFQKTDKYSSLETTGEGITIKENADVLISSLADPIYRPVKHTIECLFTLSDLETISANPLGYLTFGENISGYLIRGYLLSLKKRNNEDKAEITIIEKHPAIKAAPYASKDALYNWYAATHQHGGAIEHGYLYNWWAATDGRNIAAVNAHIPSNAEHATLSTDLGGNTIAGGHLKEAGTVHWQTPNTGADNSSGYTGLASGHRTSSGIFEGINATGYFWTSDASIGDYNEAYDSRLAFDSAAYFQGPYGQSKKCGETLRLIIDEPIEIVGSNAIYVGNDGRRYRCVLIGSIWYMAENLAETKYRNGDLITKVTGNTEWAALNSEGYCAFNNNEANAFSDFIPDIAPAGSHVPTQSEWGNILSAIRTGSPSPFTSDAGIRMKAIETWTSGIYAGDNSSGFKALGTGLREYTGNFFGKSERTQFWASDPSGSYGYVRGLEYDRPDVTYDDTVSKKYGSSVRCIMDSTILEEGQTGTITDFDGNVYQTKCIGGMEIMLSNLKVEHYNDGTPIPNVTDNEAWASNTEGARCWYDNVAD